MPKKGEEFLEKKIKSFFFSYLLHKGIKLPLAGAHLREEEYKGDEDGGDDDHEVEEAHEERLL